MLALSKRIYSGSEPEGEDGFASLEKLGIRTIVSVDGARPDVKAADRHRMRYIHIPIGYDGISDNEGRCIARAARECDGPIYFHCHHGQHRGPAAAAIACRATDGRSRQALLRILEVAGTGKQYGGLWRDVGTFKAPGLGEELPDLTEVAKVGSLAAAMAQLDRHGDDLKRCRDAGWSVPEGHPDLVPVRVALVMREGLRDARRNLAQQYDNTFNDWLSDAARTAGQLELALRTGNRVESNLQFEHLERMEQVPQTLSEPE